MRVNIWIYNNTFVPKYYNFPCSRSFCLLQLSVTKISVFLWQVITMSTAWNETILFYIENNFNYVRCREVLLIRRRYFIYCVLNYDTNLLGKNNMNTYCLDDKTEERYPQSKIFHKIIILFSKILNPWLKHYFRKDSNIIINNKKAL